MQANREWFLRTSIGDLTETPRVLVHAEEWARLHSTLLLSPSPLWQPSKARLGL